VRTHRSVVEDLEFRFPTKFILESVSSSKYIANLEQVVKMQRQTHQAGICA
jgi:hypothetical protein